MAPGITDLLLDGLIVFLLAAVVWEYYLRKKFRGKDKGGGGKEKSKDSKEKPGEAQKSSARESPFITLLIAAIIGRIALDFLPSIEPVIPLAVFAGLVGTAYEGAAVGILGYAISNVFLAGGMTGMWTVWQALGGGLAGYAAGIFGSGKTPTATHLVALTFAGTVLFEIIANLGGALGFNINYFISSLPFSVAHITGNIVIALLLVPFLPKNSEEKK